MELVEKHEEMKKKKKDKKKKTRLDVTVTKLVT
jgi:hypothetical protein